MTAWDRLVQEVSRRHQDAREEEEEARGDLAAVRAARDLERRLQVANYLTCRLAAVGWAAAAAADEALESIRAAAADDGA